MIDNFFSKNDHAEILEKYESNHFSDHFVYFNCGQHAFVEEIITASRKYVDYDNHVGYEMRFNGGTINPHRDKDEKLFDEKNILSFPLCTIIYYPHVDNMKGGELLLGNDKILPRTNRMVIFASGISHNVENFTGDRISMMVNPWAKSITYKVYESNF